MKQIFLIVICLIMAACSNDSDYGIISEPINANASVIGGVSIEEIADFAPNSQAVSSASYHDMCNDIIINGWSGISAKAIFVNNGYRPIELDAGRIYCIASCNIQTFTCSAIYDANYKKIVSRHITVAPHSSVTVYITFASVLSNANDGDDIELTFWALNEQGKPIIGLQSYGGDKSIIYRNEHNL